MQTEILYGKKKLKLDLPKNTFVITPKHLDEIPNKEKSIKSAFKNPINASPLVDLVKSTDYVSIVISDITRPTPNHILVPLIIKELSHVPLENFVIINGTGTHRGQTKAEFVQMLGKWVVDNIKIINHDCHNKDTLVNLGPSSFGCDVYLNKEYVESDFKIVTGFIEPHFFAGFSGGPKGIMPGIAGIETIMTFHNAKMIGDSRSTWGNLDNNPLQEMTKEINLLCKPDFLLNVCLNGDKEITNVFTGEIFAAHKKGCEFVKEHAMVKCEERFDLVITSNSGYPLDQNLYQAVKGMSAAQKIVKKNGTIVIASECSDGLPDFGNFSKIFDLAETPSELLQLINHPNFKMHDQWQVQKLVTILGWADIYVYSTLTDNQIKKVKLKSTNNIEKIVRNLQRKYGENMTIAVLPLGPLTIPYVEE